MGNNVFPVIDMAATGENILRLRKRRGLTVRDVQTFFGFEEPQAVYKWQSGKSLPTVDNLLALSVLLEVRMDDILVRKPNIAMLEQQAMPAAPVFLLRMRWMAQRQAGPICLAARRHPSPKSWLAPGSLAQILCRSEDTAIYSFMEE